MFPITTRVPLVALDPLVYDVVWVRSLCTHTFQRLFRDPVQYVRGSPDHGFTSIGRVVDMSVVASTPTEGAANHANSLFHIRIRNESTSTNVLGDPVFDAEVLTCAGPSPSSVSPVLMGAERVPDSDALQTAAAVLSTAALMVIGKAQEQLVRHQLEAACLMASIAPVFARSIVDQARAWVTSTQFPDIYKTLVRASESLEAKDTKEAKEAKVLSVVNDMRSANAVMAESINPVKVDSWCASHPVCGIPFVCVNLDRRPNLWMDMQTQFNAMMPRLRVIQRFSATDGDVKDPAKAAAMRALPFARFVNKLQTNALGCWDSHARIWRAFAGHDPSIPGSSALETKQSSALATHNSPSWKWILEDDGTTSPTFQRDVVALEQVLPSLAEHVDIIWTGYHLPLPKRWAEMHKFEAPAFTLLGQTLAIGGTFSYLISRRGARKLSDMMTRGYNMNAKQAVDEWMRTLPSNDLVQWALRRPIVLSYYYRPDEEAPRMSDVQIPVELRHIYEPQ